MDPGHQLLGHHTRMAQLRRATADGHPFLRLRLAAHLDADVDLLGCMVKGAVEDNINVMFLMESMVISCTKNMVKHRHFMEKHGKMRQNHGMAISWEKTWKIRQRRGKT